MIFFSLKFIFTYYIFAHTYYYLLLFLYFLFYEVGIILVALEKSSLSEYAM